MAAIVHSAGRTGTNMVLEILRGSSYLEASSMPEDKQLFTRGGTVPENYLTKCCTVYVPKPELQGAFLEANPHANIIWTIRDPRDMILSKMYRGRFGKEPAQFHDDATEEGVIQNINEMMECYYYLKEHYPQRMLVVKMEEVILNLEEETKQMCAFLKIPFERSMFDFVARMRQEEKKKYKTLDKGQLRLHAKLPEVYDGFFQTLEFKVEDFFPKVQFVMDEFGYRL